MSNHARPLRVLGAAGVVLLIAGVIALVIGLRSQHHAPQPPAAAASPVDVDADDADDAEDAGDDTIFGTHPRAAAGPFHSDPS